MFTIKNTTKNNYDFNNCVFSVSNSRPSKSLIDCNLYKEYYKIDLNLEALNEFSYINNQTKQIEYLLIRELINIFKLNIIDSESFSISFDKIIINEIKNDNYNKNIIFCFDTKITLRNTILNISDLIKELQNNDSLFMNYDNIYTYPSAELLYLLSNLFEKVKVYYSKIIKKNILYCYSYKQNKYITIFIKNTIKNWNKKSYIRQFGIYIDELILNKIKKHNTYIFEYYININKNFMYSNLEEKEYLFKNYIKKQSKITNNCFDCNHDIKEFNLFNTFICSKCYELFLIF